MTACKRSPKPELNGKRFRRSPNLAVYLVDEGKLRHVPNQTTYDLLFEDNVLKVPLDDPELDSIPFGRPLADGAYLAKADGTDDIYLISAFEVKRRLKDQTTAEKYNFALSKVRPLSRKALDDLLDGSPVE